MAPILSIEHILELKGRGSIENKYMDDFGKSLQLNQCKLRKRGIKNIVQHLSFWIFIALVTMFISSCKS